MMPRGDQLYLDILRNFPNVRVRTVFDVGANVGQSVHTFDATYPGVTIYSFEPVERAFRELMNNIKSLPNVHAYRLAIGAKNGISTIYVAEETSLSSVILQCEGTTPERVEVKTVDLFCKEYGVTAIDILKIDTEGADLFVLSGAAGMLANKLVQFIQVETTLVRSDNRRFVPLADFVELLAEFGYELFSIYDQMPHLTGRRSLGYCNAVFVSPQLL